VREAACRAIHADAAPWKARTVKTRIPRDVAIARRPGRPIPAAMAPPAGRRPKPIARGSAPFCAPRRTGEPRDDERARIAHKARRGRRALTKPALAIISYTPYGTTLPRFLSSKDRPCARRLRDLAVGMEECSRHGSNQRMAPKRTRKSAISNRWF
jgi:hypothetical protein